VPVAFPVVRSTRAAAILAASVAGLAAAAGPVDYGRDIRPILAARCFTCHGPDASTRKAGLRLDDPHEAKAPRPDGTFAIAAGDPERSGILARIFTHDPDLRMPPSGNPLTAAEGELLRRWIAEGAPYREAWSWLPIAPHDPPEVRDAAWPLDPLDRFTLARLEAAELAPAPRADPRTLLRRVSFDLVGLPPEPEELDRFAADPSPAALAREVDRLLAHPGFGEKWGRHWLDLVRYAETYGHEFDYPIPHAWRYRDAVIRAFNADLPYDRFVREHLAGDLLEPRIDPATGLDEARILTGFWWLSQGTHAPVDVAADEAERIENQIDTLAKTFLGLTVACARCHDHKFDPITQRDYYGLSAHLKRSRRTVVELDPHGEIAAARATARSERVAFEARFPVDPDAVAADTDPPPGLGGWLVDFAEPLPPGFVASGAAFARTLDERPRLERRGDRLVAAPVGVATSRAAGEAFAGSLRSPSFPIERRHLHQRIRGRGTVRVIVDGYHLDEHNPLLFEGYRRSIDRPDGFGIETWDLSRSLGRRAYLEWTDPGPGSLEIDWILATDDPAPPASPAPEPERAFGTPDDAAALAALDARPAPEPARALAIEDGTPWSEFIHRRGSTRELGEEVAPGLVASLDPAGVAAPGDRLDLAARLADPTHPLVARVMANRVWHHLFGRGIVSSVDDFGALGTPPSDPALLDHLADRFRRDWSVKGLVRSIVLSATYAMSARGDPAGDERDPLNEIPHRAALRRLEAEALRDAMLALAGRLDPVVGGPGVPTHLRPSMDGRGRPAESGPLDGAGRRSVYLEVRRNFPDPLLAAFDLPIPTATVGRRHRSNVPGQALALLNAPFVREMARAWGERIAAEEGPVEARVSRMSERAFGRPARAAELLACVDFLDADARARGLERPDPEAWAGLALVFLNAKEFLFLD